jgi:hypothetical protein
MNKRYVSFALTLLMGAAMVAVMVAGLGRPPAALANDTAQPLPFSQAWGNESLITANDDWGGVPGIQGFKGTDLATVGANPQSVLAPGMSEAPHVLANIQNVGDLSAAGVWELHTYTGSPWTAQIVALHASTTYDAPFLVFHVNTSGRQGINVSLNVIDLDPGNNADTPVALQYRVGSTGNFQNVAGANAFSADVTVDDATGQVTALSGQLGADANNQSLVQIRVITTNQSGADELIGIDDISVTGTASGEPTDPPPTDPPPTDIPPTDIPPGDERMYLPIVIRD